MKAVIYARYSSHNQREESIEGQIRECQDFAAREWLMGTKEIREGQRCLLRSEIVRIYYRHHDDRKLREYEFKNMEQCYEAYKALKGNSFIDRIHEEMKEWDIY